MEELFLGSARDAMAWVRRRRWRVALAAGVLLLAVAFFATTRVKIGGRWYGLYLLTRDRGRPFELKDDLKLGDGPRLVGGISFAPIRELFSSGTHLPRLELDWNPAEGGGVITNVLDAGTEVQTVFGRYVDDDGRAPAGLFVGGALADVAASLKQDQSGMALRDASGWHHVWCNVNEGMAIAGRRGLVYPGEWRFLDSRVVVESEDRVVLASEHELSWGSVSLRMERYAYFKAGSPWFRLGITLINVGDQPVKLSYAYGDEPWVGEFGSAAGNVGWTGAGLAHAVSWIDPRAHAWAGIADLESGVANFVGWGRAGPDRVYFGNHAGTPASEELGAPLATNEIFIGLEWLDRTIEPGEALSLPLTLGIAAKGPAGQPGPPAGAVTGR